MYYTALIDGMDADAKKKFDAELTAEPRPQPEPGKPQRPVFEGENVDALMALVASTPQSPYGTSPGSEYDPRRRRRPKPAPEGGEKP